MKVAIQGEPGSNSHMAALQVYGIGIDLVPCRLSAEVFERVADGAVDAAVLPIENSLHGSVAEHYDFLLGHEVQIAGETLLRIRHNVIAPPGVTLSEIRRILSHPVALSQCRLWLRAHSQIEVVPYYDTAGSVKTLMAEGRRDTAGVAPELAAQEYGAATLVSGIEDHADNFTRFYVLRREAGPIAGANKLSLAFALEHRPGSLISALESLAGLNLTRVESRPVPGSPWEYVFFVDLRFTNSGELEDALVTLRARCRMVRELGRYVAARTCDPGSFIGSFEQRRT